MGEKQPWLATAPLEKIPGLPDFGWRVRMDYENKKPCRPFTLPKAHQLPSLLGLSYRYFQTWRDHRRRGKKMFIDNLDLIPWKPIYGAPIGGIGCGTIGRGYRGEFCRYQMIPGMYKYGVVEANQFIVCIRKKGLTVYQQVLSPNRPKSKGLGAWNWAFSKEHAHYHALYPRSWTVYDLPGQNVRLICRQVSPVFPHDYQDTTIPGAGFIWTIENNNTEPIEVSIMFTFKNGQGVKEDKEGGVWSQPFHHSEPKATEGEEGEDGEGTSSKADVSGVMIHQQFRDMKCTYAVGAKHKDGVKVTHCVAFDPRAPAKEVWLDLMSNGELNSSKDPSEVTRKGEELAVAVCAKCTVEQEGTGQLEFSLVWDMPVVQFGSKGRTYARRYARWFGQKGDAAPKLSSYVLNTYQEWEKKIEEWQNPILQNISLPAWYKSALFNELYFVSDGGTIWVDPIDEPPTTNGPRPVVSDLVKEYSKFAYLEGQEYRMYNTYDVHHYASYAIVMLWPKIQLSLQYDIAEAVPKEQTNTAKYCMNGEILQTKMKDAVPHDVGDPDDEVWENVNAYLIHPTQEWKDLNTKFILQVYRDYIYTKDLQFLKDMYQACKAVMNKSLRWDTDDDGIIDNAGFADQTYDAWSQEGASAYCGGMWLGAVKMFVEMAKVLGHPDDEKQFIEILEKGKLSYESKLWNGEYYNYDSSKSTHHDSVMADQLAGHWFLKASDIPDDSVFPREHILKALDSIFKHNIMPFEEGTMGAINGMRPNGKKDFTSVQSEEFWTGVTYGLAATMFQEGKLDMGWQTGYGAYHVCWEEFGLHFQTPEAYIDDRRYRSLGYMRPLCIWSMQYALERFHPQMVNSLYSIKMGSE